MRYSYTYGATTDKGDVRSENQDSILCLINNFDGEAAALFAVADGMGGLSHGSRVSRYIMEQFERWWKEDFMQMVLAGMDREEDIRELLEQEIWDINQSILSFNRSMQCRSGSTLSLILLYKGRYYIENIGDSRVYQMRKGCLVQLTEDQSVVAQLVRERGMTEREARNSCIKHMLTMCVGMFEIPESFFVSGSLTAGDHYCLCSDGLYNSLDQEGLESVLASNVLGAREKAIRLRQMIFPGAATDNVSVIVVGVSEEGCRCGSREEWKETKRE